MAPNKQSLAIDPSYPDQATIGGIVATADTGFLRQKYGGVRDRVIGISAVRVDGQPTKAGGRVVKNVAGYDLMKLFTGSWGTLGIISQLTLRLYPQPEASKTICFTGAPDAIQTLAAQLFASTLTPTAFAIVIPSTIHALRVEKLNKHSKRQFSLLARFQSIAVSIQQQSKQLIQWGQNQALTGETFEGQPEVNLWQQLSTQRSQSPFANTIICKVGIAPASIVPLLDLLLQKYPMFQGWINGGNGIGLLYANTDSLSIEILEQVRSHCIAHNGFLTVLSAPREWKETMDLWGYQGNNLKVMTQLKQQFDPYQQLNSGRYL